MKNETKHTPGPWVVDWPHVSAENRGDLFNVVYSEEMDVAEFCEPQKTARANLVLAAAAPDLLEACEAVAKLMDGQGRANLPEVSGMARAAIAKAKGD